MWIIAFYLLGTVAGETLYLKKLSLEGGFRQNNLDKMMTSILLYTEVVV